MSTVRVTQRVHHGSLPLPSRRRCVVRRLTPTVGLRVSLLQLPLRSEVMLSFDLSPPMLPLLLTTLQPLNRTPTCFLLLLCTRSYVLPLRLPMSADKPTPLLLLLLPPPPLLPPTAMAMAETRDMTLPLARSALPPVGSTPW